MKFPRNSGCWCGSGLKYKNCHFILDSELLFMEQGSTPERIKAGQKTAKYYRKRYLEKINGS